MTRIEPLTSRTRRSSWAGLSILISVLVAGASACASSEGDETPYDASAEVRLLAIGDSVLEWNEDNATPVRAAELLNERGIATIVENRAVSGSCLGTCDDAEEAIATTYSDDGWTHLLVSGGGNDIEDCASADPILSEDLTSGLIVDLLDRVPASTTVLLYVYAPPIDPNDPLASCAEFERLQARYRALAEARAGVELVDASSVADASTPELYADSVHPSPAGSAAIGTLVADVIEASLDN
ncbi:MAG: SGNH/GDSL hydrolase family protein [Polyangiales bacterium]